MSEDGDTTETIPEVDPDAKSAGLVPVLLLLGGGSRDQLGRRRVVRLPAALTVCRGTDSDRADPARLTLPDGLLSREHCRVRRLTGGYEVEDAGSLNGTFLDGHRLDQPARLSDGCVLSFGEHAAVFRHASDRALAAIDEDGRRAFGPVATFSPKLAQTLATLKRLARVDEVELLLLGETGVGKEVYARAIHKASGRAGRFVGINCAAIPLELAETELFGSARGAHSTATEAKAGLIAAADGGTLFLDEIGDMNPRLQAKLLRFLQERDVTPVGSTQSRRIDVKVIAASSGPEGPGDGPLRDDLLARLGAEPIEIPPLRERVEDIGALAAHFAGAAGASFEPDAFRALALYPWPRNVRELEKVVTRALAVCENRRIGLAHLPVALREATRRGATIEARRRPRPGPSRAELQALMGKHRGNVAAVAKELDRQWNVVWRWLVKFQLRPESYRS